MPLLQIAFWMFAAGASGGVLLLAANLFHLTLPRWLPAAHGLLGVASSVVLGYAVFIATPVVPELARWALAVLAAALLGGIVLFVVIRPQRGRALLGAGHGVLALAGLWLLFQAAW